MFLHDGDHVLNPEKQFLIDNCHVIDYIEIMIKSFADRQTKAFYETGKSKKLPPELLKRALRKLDYIENAEMISDLKIPPGNRLHELTGTRSEQFSISVNDQWRICFRFVDGDAFDVELVDYH